MFEEDFWTKSYKVQCFVHELIQRVQSIPSIINQSALLQCPALFNSHDQQQVTWDRIWNRRVPCCIVAFALAISMILFIAECKYAAHAFCLRARTNKESPHFFPAAFTQADTQYLCSIISNAEQMVRKHTHILHKTVDTNSPINIIYPCPIVVCILISNTEKSITIRSNVTHKTNRYAHAILLQQCCNGIYSKFSEMSLRLFAIAIGQYYAYGIPLRQCAHSPITLHSRAKIDGNQQKKTCNKSAVQPFCHMSRSKRSHRGGRTQKFIIIMFTATRLYEVR